MKRIPLIAACLLAQAGACFAHPMGNFSINHYAKLSVGPKSVQVTYVIDMAEIPTFQEMRQFNLRPEPESAEAASYLAAKEEKLESGLSLRIDGRPVQLVSRSRHIQFAEGAGGLSTMKIDLELQGNIEALQATRHLVWADNNFAERAGWKEVVVVADGVRLIGSSGLAIDRSNQLTNYSTDAIASPPQDVGAEVTFQNLNQPRRLTKAVTLSSSPTLSAIPAQKEAAKVSANPAQNTPRNRFTQLISTQGI